MRYLLLLQMLSAGRRAKGVKAATATLLRRFLASVQELGEALCVQHNLSAVRDHSAAVQIKVSADTLEFASTLIFAKVSVLLLVTTTTNYTGM